MSTKINFSKTLVIDGKGHILGRLAARVAKAILRGQKVVVVRCEELLLHGTFRVNQTGYEEYLNKRMNTNPKKGPFHHRAPSRHIYKVIRAMVHRKTARGRDALSRLSLFDGCPEQYNKTKRVVCPAALAHNILKARTPVTRLGDLLKRMGWKYHDVVVRAEAVRKANNDEYAKEATRKLEAIAQAKEELKNNTQYQTLVSKLAELGY
ncbi:hypothetical protein ABK040_016773 [Willaertia magna]